jgi:hypothetical protein
VTLLTSLTDLAVRIAAAGDTSNLQKYYPHHLPAGPTYAGVAVLVVLAVISIVKKIIFLALLLVIVAVALGLYHQGALNHLLHTGAKYRTMVQNG